MSLSRIAGLVCPLFSIRTRSDWGIGQITDIPACAEWARGAGQRLLQILPPYELADGETSPYGARTAFGLDPIYITIEAVPDLDPEAIARALGEEGERELRRLRALPVVDYAAVRALKRRVMKVAFSRFLEREWNADGARAEQLSRFIRSERDWASDLALYVALRDAHDGFGWESWPEPEKTRSLATLERARRVIDHVPDGTSAATEGSADVLSARRPTPQRGLHQGALDHDGALATRMLEHLYLQWIAHEEWDLARKKTRALGVELMGDLPFIVGSESADVWAHAGQFRRDVSLGAPPDEFSDEGQNWGLPAYDWAAMDADGLGWLRARTRHATRLYDRFRLDHVVGYFRQWVRRPGERGFFDPADEGAQRARGEKVLRAILDEAGDAKVIAEDLGVIPPFVRDTMRALGLPGYKVLPWEKDERRQIIDPATFPPLSVASWSTHDTLPITLWWAELDAGEKARIAELSKVNLDAPDDVRTLALLKLLYGAGSELTLTLAPELLGESLRINTPGIVGDGNWTYRLPRPIDELAADAAIRARLAEIRELSILSGRAAR